MSQPVADRNLLFGVLAMQMDFITRDQLIAAMQTWVFDKSKPLGQILVSQNALAADNHQLLEALVQKHLAMHDNNPEKSLAAVSSVGSFKKELEKIADPNVQASLVHVSATSHKDIDVYATVGPAKSSPGGTGVRFRILRPHARGGLGEVYVAHDEELHREVALKEIQDRQADNPESRSRFLVEAEITGGLEHPGIVPVYGLGTYADGRPYYAMRFIRGDSLKDAIDRFHRTDTAGKDPGQRTLELRGLLGRFVDVCNAIAYAHSRGVLHRDLKPGNIMLGKYGETLVVDWGLAKPMGEATETPRPTEPGEGSLIPHSISSSSQTLMGTALGTPQYMSPEQAAGRTDQLGPASDVYSLGATLYCVLTGKAPFSDKDVGIVLQKVQRGEFPRPSEVKANMSQALEAICAKAMSVTPADRYASPNALANDIEHWLADEPVSAWPEPWTAKARRWIGRHRTLVTSAASAALMVLVGLVVTTALLAAANERERHAKARAEQNFRLARAAVDRYHTEVSQDDLLNEPGMQPLRKKLLEAAKEFYEKFKSERAGDPTVQAELGKATYRLAQITGDIGSELDAIRLHQEAVHLFETLPTPQADADTRSDLAASYHHLGRLYRLTDQMTLSQGAYLKALTLWEALVKDEPTEDRFQDGLARTQLGLGNFYRLAGKLDAAQDFYRRASEKWAALRHANPKTSSFRRDLAIAQHNLGNLLKTVEGNEADAAKMLRSAQSLQKQLVAEAPNIGQYQSDLAKTDYSLGEYQGAATLWQTLVDRHPAVTEPHKTLAEAYTSLAMMYAQTAPKKAEESCQQALAIKRKLAANHPGVPSYQGELARGLSTLGAVLEWSGPLDKSTTAYKEALAIQDKLVRDLPDVPHYRRDLAHTHNGLGRLYAKHKQAVKADNEHKKALALWQALAKNQRLDLEYRLGECKTCVEIAHLASAEGKYKDAIGWYNQAHTLAPTKMKPAILLPRSAALARSGDYLEATKEAGDLVAKATSGTARYQFAVVYALSAAAVAGDMQRALPERQKLAEQYADAAVKLLISAYEAPAFRTPANLEKLKTDPDLKALRDRPDFKKLLSDRAL